MSAELHSAVRGLMQEVAALRTEVAALRQEIAPLTKWRLGITAFFGIVVAGGALAKAIFWITSLLHK